MVSNKFIGHGIVIGIFVLQPILFNFGLGEHPLSPGATPPYTYSDMNGYGHFVPALFWSITYWPRSSHFSASSPSPTRAAARTTLSARVHVSPFAALPRLAPAAGLLLLLAVGSGIWYFINAHVATSTSPPKVAATSRPATSVTSSKYELTCSTQSHRRRNLHQHLSRTPLLRRHRRLHASEQNLATALRDPPHRPA